MKHPYKLPDGTETTSIKKYKDEWRKFCKPIENRLGLMRFAFDPGALFTIDGKTIDLPNWFIKLFNEKMEAGNGNQSDV
jgi:hypothetical protein